MECENTCIIIHAHISLSVHIKVCLVRSFCPFHSLDGKSIIEIILDNKRFMEDGFERCLEFLYTGSCDLKKEDSQELTESTLLAVP